MITKKAFENFKIYNICPKNEFIKFQKKDRYKKVKRGQDSNPRPTDCMSTLHPAELYTRIVINNRHLPERKSCGILAVPYPKAINIDKY